MSDQQEVADATRITQFLEDPVVAGAFRAAAEELFRKFCAPGQTSWTLQVLHAEAQALTGLRKQLAIVVGKGEAAAHRIAAEKKKEQARP